MSLVLLQIEFPRPWRIIIKKRLLGNDDNMYLIRAGTSRGKCSRSSLLLLLLHVINPTADGAGIVYHGLLLLPFLHWVDHRVDVLLPLLDDPLPLPPAIPPVLLRSPGVAIWALRFGNKTDVLVVGDGILSVGNLFLSSEINRNSEFKDSLWREFDCTSLKLLHQSRFCLELWS